MLNWKNRIPFLTQKRGASITLQDGESDLRAAHLSKLAALAKADTGGEREGEYFLFWLSTKRKAELEKPRYLSGQTAEQCALFNAVIESRLAVWDELRDDFIEAQKAAEEKLKQVVIEKEG